MFRIDAPTMQAVRRYLLVFGLLLLLLLALSVDASASQVDPDSDPETRAHAYLALDPPDWDAALAAFIEAAEAGSPTAMSYVGWLHEQGHGVPRDGERAAEWYARAALAGARDFAVKLGWMYLGGDGVPRDRGKAEYWFGQAIEAGHGPGRIAWASVLIADAQGGRNPEGVFEAQELLEAALAQGFPLAAYFLARLYIEGIGSHPVDDDLAALYTRIGAESGYPRMQGWLALMYYEGRGVDQDPVAAAQWANLAAANGDAMGNRLRLALEEELDPEQVDSARKQALEWALQQR
jgi:uncharacterized protein